MPLYEFRCRECDQPFEALVFGGEQAECPSCHSTALEPHLMSLPAAPREDGPTACRSEGPPCGPVCGRWGK